jgi:malonyl-CoA/methylmalonyl-CoA synthetase
VTNLTARAREHGDRIAVLDATGPTTYAGLLDRSARLAGVLLDGRETLDEARVAFLIPPSAEWVVTQWAIWRAGGIAVPLSPSHPRAEIEYVLADADVSIVVVAPELADRVAGVNVRLIEVGSSGPSRELPGPADRAMILYTSGTTGKPKGVVSTHGNIEAQIKAMVAAWEWTRDDRTLLVLPLHHVHGIVNVVCTALWNGASCEMAPRFEAYDAWRRIIDGNLTVFMAVPTVYARLTAAWEQASPDEQRAMSDACRRMRLMVSGSAALPVTVLERWREISGHTLLERYGMTEIGMGLTNPLHGLRAPGHVGFPFPSVEIRLVDESGTPLPNDDEPGEIEVRGPSVFSEYWGRPEETRDAFHDGWFRTGDVALREPSGYRILGRRSTDIIKSGGYKVSALEIEEVLRTHPRVAECAVVGVPDAEMGERISAAIELRDGDDLSLAELREWLKDRLARYKIPAACRTVAALPRNQMGKIVKPDIVRWFV